MAATVIGPSGAPTHWGIQVRIGPQQPSLFVRGQTREDPG